MSEKMTRIRLPGQKFWSGFLEWGEKTPQEMIDRAVAQALFKRREADLVLEALNTDFEIDIVRGPIVQHHVKNLQKGRS